MSDHSRIGALQMTFQSFSLIFCNLILCDIRSIWCCRRVTRVAPRSVIEVSCVAAMKHECRSSIHVLRLSNRLVRGSTAYFVVLCSAE